VWINLHIYVSSVGILCKNSSNFVLLLLEKWTLFMYEFFRCSLENANHMNMVWNTWRVHYIVCHRILWTLIDSTGYAYVSSTDIPLLIPEFSENAVAVPTNEQIFHFTNPQSSCICTMQLLVSSGLGPPQQ